MPGSNNNMNSTRNATTWYDLPMCAHMKIMRFAPPSERLRYMSTSRIAMSTVRDNDCKKAALDALKNVCFKAWDTSTDAMLNDGNVYKYAVKLRNEAYQKLNQMGVDALKESNLKASEIDPWALSLIVWDYYMGADHTPKLLADDMLKSMKKDLLGHLDHYHLNVMQIINVLHPAQRCARAGKLERELRHVCCKQSMAKATAYAYEKVIKAAFSEKHAGAFNCTVDPGPLDEHFLHPIDSYRLTRGTLVANYELLAVLQPMNTFMASIIEYMGTYETTRFQPQQRKQYEAMLQKEHSGGLDVHNAYSSVARDVQELVKKGPDRVKASYALLNLSYCLYNEYLDATVRPLPVPAIIAKYRKKYNNMMDSCAVSALVLFDKSMSGLPISGSTDKTLFLNLCIKAVSREATALFSDLKKSKEVFAYFADNMVAKDDGSIQRTKKQIIDIKTEISLQSASVSAITLKDIGNYFRQQFIIKANQKEHLANMYASTLHQIDFARLKEDLQTYVWKSQPQDQKKRNGNVN